MSEEAQLPTPMIATRTFLATCGFPQQDRFWRTDEAPTRGVGSDAHFIQAHDYGVVDNYGRCRHPATPALALGTAACITGQDKEKIARLPHTNGLKNKVVIQKVQHYHYEHVPTIVGTTLVEAGDDTGTKPEQLTAALDPDTAAVLYVAHM